MATKIRLGYDILAKRAIETESGINIDDALRRIHSYEMVGSTGDDKHPDVPTGSESDKILYVTKPDYTAWIWSTDSTDPGWICIGGAAGDSWKTWSEEHGSTADGIENAVYIGPDNDIEREDTFILGDGNTVKTTDNTDYSGTEVITIGLENTATNAAIAYQLGRHNSITGNNLADKQQYPNQLSMNLGDSNVINGEGINIGKCNTSTGFGVTLGQNNTAQSGSLVLGSGNAGGLGSVVVGKDVTAQSGSLVLGSGNAGGSGSVVVGKDITLNTDGSVLFGDRIRLVSGDTGEWSKGVTALGMDIQVSNGAFAVGRDRILANNGSVVVGVANITGTGGSIAIGHDGCSATNGGLSVGSSISSDSGSISIGKYGSSTGGGIQIGNYNTANTGIAMGSNNSVSSLAIGIGYRNTMDSSSYGIGSGNNATRNSCAFGINNDSRSQSVFIGYNNTRGEAIVNSSSDGIGVAIGTQNILTNGAYNLAFGQENEVGHEAIALGNNNLVYGWSTAIGYHNQTVANRGAHAMMLGSYNTSNSTLEYLEKTYQQAYTGSYTPTSQESAAVTSYRQTITTILNKYMASSDVQKINNYMDSFVDYCFGVTNTNPTPSSEVSALINSTYTNPTYIVSDADKTTFNNAISDGFSITVFRNCLQVMSHYLDVSNYIDAANATDDLWEFYYSPIGQEAYNAIMWFYYECVQFEGTPTQSIITNSTDYSEYMTAVTGFNNICGSIRNNVNAALQGGTVTVSKQIYNNSLISGSNNTSNHYNSILIGSYNTSKAPINGESSVSDDDGFMVAIGFENTVGRNYDFAFGYRSVANGGENIAIQHSSAIGYRNIAMIDSTVTGIANLALVESTFTPSNTLSAHNFLFNSSGTVEATGSESGGVQRNVFIDVYHAITAQNVSENFIFGGTGKQHDISPVTITGGKGASGNIMFGSPHKSPNYSSGTFTITTSTSACDNVFIHPKEVNISADTIQDTAIMGKSTVNMMASSSILDNIISASTLSGTCHTLHGNTFISNSSLETERTGIPDGSIRYNLVMNESSVYANKNVPSFWTGSSQPIAYNIVSGSIASDTHACIAIGDGMLASQPTNTVTNSKFSFVFGDNYAERTQITTAIGTENNVVSADHTIVYGTLNNVIGQGNTLSSNGIISTSLVFGRENIVHTHSNGTGYNLAYGTVIGTKNYLYATRADSIQIFGTENIVSKDVVPVSKTVEQITAIQQQFESDQSISYPSIVKFSNSGTIIRYNGSMPSQRYTTQVTAGDVFVFSPYENYNHVVFALQGAKQRENARLLPTDDYIGLNINNVLIAGNGNTVGDRIVGYTILGRDNTLTNQLNPSSTTFAISNGFIQGSNNTVSNGSHIVCMGNGNVSSGHNSAAIGLQLISRQWQTVIGKYNSPIDGPDRLTAPSATSQKTKALFIVGNGYSTKDNSYWQDEDYITRSNALELYADGSLKVAGAITGESLSVTGTVNASNIPAAPSADGTYTLQCVVSNGTATYSWAPVGFTTVS